MPRRLPFIIHLCPSSKKAGIMHLLVFLCALYCPITRASPNLRSNTQEQAYLRREKAALLSLSPTTSPSTAPTISPTEYPSEAPSAMPTTHPTLLPTLQKLSGVIFKRKLRYKVCVFIKVQPNKISWKDIIFPRIWFLCLCVAYLDKRTIYLSLVYIVWYKSFFKTSFFFKFSND